MENICYTIGHTNRSNEDFLKLLRTNDINCIIDVRSQPYSKYVPQYNRENIKSFLTKHEILYIFMGKELGARREDMKLYDKDGIINFSMVSETELFNAGIMRIIAGINKGYRIAIMCTEKDAFDCHRFILISKALKERGICVEHIYDDYSNYKMSELEFRLIEKYCDNYRQINLFQRAISKDEALEIGYKKRNIDIGYRKDG